MRLVNEGNDALDPTLQRTGYRGERNQVVLHHDVHPDGTLGPGQVHLDEVIPDTVARFLACDSRSASPPTEPACCSASPRPSGCPRGRCIKRMERRDQGCVHPLCNRRRWLHPRVPLHAAPPRAPRRAVHDRRQPRSPQPAVPRRSRETESTHRRRLARAPPPRRAHPLRPALRRPPRHRFLQLELIRRARPRDEGGGLSLRRQRQRITARGVR